MYIALNDTQNSPFLCKKIFQVLLDSQRILLMHVQGIENVILMMYLAQIPGSSSTTSKLATTQNWEFSLCWGQQENLTQFRIFPKESCTCPSTGRCYHILAVRMSIGIEDIGSRRKVNLTQLRCNTRSRSQKKSGRKAPRPEDYDVESAPNASITTKDSAK